MPSGTRDGSPFEPEFRQEVLDLLGSGQAKVDGRETVDGREAVRIVSADGSTVYLVDAGTSNPIELRTTGMGGGTVLRFLTYEELPATPENLALLSIADQHPDATIDTDPAYYREAQEQLFPNG